MILEGLRGGLVVSVQADAGSVLNTPEIIAALADCAQRNGAAAVRIEGLGRIAAVADRMRVPVIGLVKRTAPGCEVYITPTLDDVADIARAGAGIIAFDATERPRPDGSDVAAMVRAIHVHGALAMADCARREDGLFAAAAGADILATTLCGYTAQTMGTPLPAFELLAALGTCGRFTVCEGGVARPADVRAAFERGADAVCVGTAITNVDRLVASFVAAASRGERVE